MIQLRDYQLQTAKRVVDAWAQHKNVIMLMPTGAGKTKTAVALIAQCYRQWHKNIIVLLHTRELRQQWEQDINRANVPYGVIAAGKAPNPYARVQIAQVQSLHARLDKEFFQHHCDLLVVDEAHHSAARTYQECFDALQPTAMLGLTATPARVDGRGLDPPYKTIVEGPKVAELITRGQLSEYKIYSLDLIDRSKLGSRAGDFVAQQSETAVQPIVADCVDAWRRYGSTHQTIVFCVTRAHGREVASRFRRAGVRTSYADGAMSHRERDREINLFRNRETQIIVSVDLLGEGVDIPGASCALLLRPTKSVSRHLQRLGRVIRPHDHASNQSVIIDCVGDCRELGGPRTPILWSLAGIVKRSRAANAEVVPTAETSRSERTEIKTELVVINDRAVRITRHANGRWDQRCVSRALYYCPDLHSVQQLGKTLGYRDGWAKIRWELLCKRRSAPQ